VRSKQRQKRGRQRSSERPAADEHLGDDEERNLLAVRDPTHPKGALCEVTEDLPNKDIIRDIVREVISIQGA
jgi:hypothetical protein